MNGNLMHRLKGLQDYKDFMKKRKMRALGALAVDIVFGGIVCAATDFKNIDDSSMVYLGIFLIATIVILKLFFDSFVKRPSILLEGEIVEIKEETRTVKEEDRLQTRITHRYKICSEKNEYWGECIVAYNTGREIHHSIGEKVLYFSLGPGNSYIVKV